VLLNAADCGCLIVLIDVISLSRSMLVITVECSLNYLYADVFYQ